MGSAITPGDTGNDPPEPIFQLGAEQLAILPSDLRAELEARKGEGWVRGFAYAPENHGSAWLRDRCDGSTYDFEALPSPAGLTAAAGTGGTLSAGTYTYEATYVNSAGETTPSSPVSQLVSASGTVTITIPAGPSDITGIRIYGRSGTLGLLTTITGPFEEGESFTWTDTGSGTPGAAAPSSNTTGGSGVYTNASIVTVIPYVIETMDTCSSFGFTERDFKGRALRWLDNATPRAIEAEFWTGTLAQAKGYPNNYLTMGSANPNWQNLTPGTIPSIARGMQILEDALAQCGLGGQGMIHCQAQTAPNLLSSRRVGKLLLDIFDNIVVPGVGYTGTGPGNSTPTTGTSWIYATDLVMVRTQDEGTVYPDSFEEALDRGEGGQPNTITFRAERFGVAYADFQCFFGCQVDLAS